MFGKDELPIIGILRGIEEKDIVPLAEVFIRTGLKYVEITMNTEGATHLIPKMIEAGGKYLVVGAGTVLTIPSLNDAIKAGARFIVTPSLKDEIVISCVKQNIPVFPGILTPTELHRAIELGSEYQKLFPGGAFQPSYIKALKGPFNNAKIVAVGGVDENNVAEYVKNGADGIAFGAGIVKPEWLKNSNYEMIEKKLSDLINCYRQALR